MLHIVLGDVGSGKTTFCLQDIAACVAEGKQGIFLVPEQETVGLEVVQHLVGLGYVFMEGGGGLVHPACVAVQKGLDRGDVLLGHDPEGPVSIGLQEAVDVVAFFLVVFTRQVCQVTGAVNIVRTVSFFGHI